MWLFYIFLIFVGIFLIQFNLSFFFRDLDSEIKFDKFRFSLSDLLEIKGLVHFGMGTFLAAWFFRNLDSYYLAATLSICSGLVFVIIFGLIYHIIVKYFYKSEHGEDLVGRDVTISLDLRNGDYIARIIKDNSKKSLRVHSDKHFQVGDQTIIKKFEKGVFYI